MRIIGGRKGLVAGLMMLAAVGSAARAAEVVDKIDWGGFLGRNDMVWEKLPAKWEEGAYMGNGLLGANIFLTADGNNLSWHIGRSDVVSKGARVAIGDMVLKTVGKIEGGDLRLDLWNAEMRGTLKTSAGTIKIRSYTHADQMVNVIEIQPDAGEKACAFAWRAGVPIGPPARNVSPVNAAASPQGAPPEKTEPPTLSEVDGAKASTQMLPGGGEDAAAWKEIPGANGSRTMLVSVGYSKKEGAAKEAVGDLTNAGTTGMDQLLTTHRDWWHKYWQESFVSIPDARMESFYQVQMYKLGSATRADRQVIDLMGPWFKVGTPWPRIWWNLNIQLTYWPIYTANRLELGEPFCKILDDNKPQLAKNTRRYAEDSYAIGRSGSYDLVRTAEPEVGNLTWALHNYWLQYRYSMDDAMLRDRLFPLLKGNMNYMMHLLKKGEDGKLHISLGLSPEYPGQPTPNPDTNYDLGLLRWGLQTALATCERLKIDDPLIPKWKETLADLTPYPVDENGLMISPTTSVKESHRHYSHMLMVYPLYIMNPEQPENLPLIEKSFAHWISMPAAFRGFSYTGASSISSMLGRGDDAATWMNKWFDTDTKFKVTPNTMYAEAGPVIESPLSGAAAVNDMLLTSWGGKLRVFPGVSSKWENVAFNKLRGEGAFLVSAVRKGGKTQFIRIESLAGEPCKLVTDMAEPFPRGMGAVAGRMPVTKVGANEYDVWLEKGKSYVLTSGGAAVDLTMEAVPSQGKANAWGLK